MRRKDGFGRGSVPAGIHTRWARRQRWVTIELPDDLRARLATRAEGIADKAIGASGPQQREQVSSESPVHGASGAASDAFRAQQHALARPEGRALGGGRSGDRRVLAWAAFATATLVLTGCAAALLGRATSSGAYGEGSSQSKPAAGSSSQQDKSTPASGSTGSQQQSGGTATAPAGSGARTAAQVEQDRQLVVAVRNRLSADAATKGLSIAVDTYRSVVTLRGSVDQAEQRSAAERVARGVSGVRNVQNELRVR